MKFSIDKDTFGRLMYLTSGIVERRNTMPILANVKIKAEGTTVSLSATDLEISIVGKAEADVKTEGSITVDAKVLHDYIKELPSGLVTFQASKGQRLEIALNQSRSKFNGTTAEEFPEIAGTSLVGASVFSAKKMADMLQKTAIAVSTDEVRFNLTGIFIETFKGNRGDRLRFVSTDGHRLAMVDRDAEGFVLNEGIIIPRKGITELQKLLEGNDGIAHCVVNEGFFTVSSCNVTMGIRLRDGVFPDYRQAIPVGAVSEAEVDRQELIGAVRRASLVTTDKSRTLRCRLDDGNLIIISVSPEHGEATETLTVKQTGENVSIGLSAKYLLDLLNAMSDSKTIKVKFNGECGQVIFVGTADEDYSCIVMPMRL